MSEHQNTSLPRVGGLPLYCPASATAGDGGSEGGRPYVPYPVAFNRNVITGEGQWADLPEAQGHFSLELVTLEGEGLGV